MQGPNIDCLQFELVSTGSSVRRIPTGPLLCGSKRTDREFGIFPQRTVLYVLQESNAILLIDIFVEQNLTYKRCYDNNKDNDLSRHVEGLCDLPFTIV